MFHTLYQTLLEYYPEGTWWPHTSVLEVAVGTILTQNTNWNSVEKSILRLKEAGKLDMPSLLEMPEEELAELIRPSGYANLKTRRLKNLLRFVSENYGTFDALRKQASNLSRDMLREQLLTVNGVGRETADSILLYALEIPSFVVDSYTRRVLSRHKILPEDAPYDTIRKAFEQEIPLEVTIYSHFHAMIVELCKEFCVKNSPRCEACPLRKL